MGLDVTGYKRTVPVKEHEARAIMEAEDPREAADLFGAHVPTIMDKEFPGRSEGLWLDTPYLAEEEYGFAMGSYSAYNWWRAQLAKLVGIDDLHRWWRENDVATVEGPFAELLHFSDCEGTLGPEASRRLARDFAEWQERATEFAAKIVSSDPDDGPWWIKKYGQMRRAFELGAQEGYVEFT